MIRIWIGGQECEVDSSTQISLSYDGDSLSDLEKCQQERSLTINMPLNSANESLLGLAGDVHPESKFNAEGHSMTLEVDGIEIFSAVAYLKQVVWEKDTRYIYVECRTQEAQWASSAAETLFSQIAIEYENALNQSNIKASWSDDSPVKFFPIVRDQYDEQGSNYDVTGVRLLRSIDDYHPFISLSALLDAIFSTTGYTFESSTAATEFFDKLYISGDYSSAENEAARAAMGFYAKRAEDTTTTADSLGRISMSPYTLYSTVGNIVDLSTVESDSECYNYSGVLQIDDQALTFRPTTQISVGFEYFLHYTCECDVESRTKLKGIDTLNTISGGNVEWEITNRYVDYRESHTAKQYYTLMIFDFEDGDSFELYGTYNDGSKVFIRSITSRTTSFTMPDTYDSLRLDIASGSGYITYTEDWALYSGYVSGITYTEVEITVRSSPETYSPTSPMEFELQLLQGAKSGASFTLHSDSSVRPYFSSYPGYNSVITFEDIAQHSFSALDLLSSIQHLFNLRFVTNEAAKVVTIESYDQFYSGMGEYDWSDKVVEDEAIEFSDIAFEKNRYTKLGYQQTDGVVVRLGESDNKYFGEWSYTVDSYAASATDRTSLNPILCATTNDDDGVMLVGDRDDLDTVDSLSFSPRIARYFEMVEIDGENYSLPYVAFHAPERGFSLCFEDRDDTEGLNRLYANEVSNFGRAQMVTLTLSISAYDYSNLFAPSSMSPSLRSIFCFDLHGESFRCILHSIESYNPSTGRARCQFLTLD